VLLCWQTWASFGYRAGSVVTWRGNGSIPGGYPPPGVSQRPSYAVHCSYIVVVRTSSSFSRSVLRSLSYVLRMLSYVVRTLSYIVRTSLYAVCLHLYVVVRMLSSFGPSYVVVRCSLSFVCCRTLFVRRHTPFVFVCTSSFVCHRTLFVVLRTLSLWQCT
jgi:hypothetical protein